MAAPITSGPGSTSSSGANPAALASAVRTGNATGSLDTSGNYVPQAAGEQEINGHLTYTGVNPATGITLPASNNDTTAKTTPIISANSATQDYFNKQGATNQISQGVQQQAQANAQNQQNAVTTSNTQGGTNQNTSTQSGQISGKTDNTDLTNALNNANTTLNSSVKGDYQSAISQITPNDLAAFRQANPGLPFTKQDLDKYNQTTGVIEKADEQTKNNNQSLTNDQATRDAATQQFNDAVAKIISGTFPLTAPQQASLNQTQQAVNGLIQSAQQQAQLYSQAATTFGAVHGLAQFAPGLALQAISAGMAKGQAAIAQAEMNGTKQLADLQKSFADDDFSMISKSYDALQSSLDKKDTLLNKLNSDIQTQVKDYQAQQDKVQTNSREALNTILTQLGGTAFNNLSPEAQAQLKELERKAGWPAGLVEQGLNTVAQQKLADQQAQLKIANEFKQAALAQGQQRINISFDKSGLGGVDNGNGNVVGVTGSPTVDATQPGYASQAVAGAGGLTQAAIDQAALSYATSGVMPSMGLGSTGAAGQKRTAIQNRAAELDANGSIQGNKATLAANSAALKQQTTLLNTVTRSINNADNGIKQLISSFQSKGINDSSLPISNIIQNGAKYQLGNGDISAYKAGLQEVANEYSQVFSRGGQNNQATQQRAQDIIDGNISIANLQKVSDELQAQGKIVIDGSAKQIHDIQNNINSIVTGSGNPNTSKSPSNSIPTAPKGEINVKDNKTGKIGHVPISEYDVTKYSKYQS